MARDYKHEYAAYQGKPEQIKHRAERNAARREMEKKGLAHKGDGKDVGHKKSLRDGGSNKPSNTKMQSVASNRGWRRGKSSYNPD